MSTCSDVFPVKVARIHIGGPRTTTLPQNHMLGQQRLPAERLPAISLGIFPQTGYAYNVERVTVLRSAPCAVKNSGAVRLCSRYFHRSKAVASHARDSCRGAGAERHLTA